MTFLRSLAATLTLLATPPLTMAAAPDLACRFEAVPQADGRVTVRFTLRNAGAQPVYLLRWGSPFEDGWFGPFMTVRTAQGELRFQGAMRKRGDPSAQDYLRLPAGQTVAATVTLNDAFNLPATGPLALQAAWRWHDVMRSGNPPRLRDQHQGQDQDCGSVNLQR